MILLNRFSSIRNTATGPNQAGFQPGMGCLDQFFILWQILELLMKHNQITIAVFIDFITAFDSIVRDGIYVAMQEDGVLEKLIRLIQVYYKHVRVCIQAAEELCSLFEIDFGVRQGCILSPSSSTLFLLNHKARHAICQSR